MVKAERQLAPWLPQPAIQAVGRVAPHRLAPAGPGAQHRLRRDARREQLLLACLVDFTSRGLEKTTMDTIAAQAGVSKPLVYRHFHSRFEALLAVVERQSELVLDTMGLSESGGEVPRFEALVADFLQFAVESPAGFRLLFHLVDANPGPARRRLDQLRHQLSQALVASMLGEVGHPASEDLAERCSWLGDLVLSILEGAASGMAKGEEPARKARALQSMLRPAWVVSALVESGIVPRGAGLQAT